MKPTAVFALAPLALVLAACGSGGAQTTKTIAGVGVALHGRPALPNTTDACARRWNGSANGSGRRSAVRRAPQAHAALVRTAGSAGYLRELAGRCSVSLIGPPGSAAVFVETARGRFTFVADASGPFSPNAELSPRGRLRLR